MDYSILFLILINYLKKKKGGERTPPQIEIRVGE